MAALSIGGQTSSVVAGPEVCRGARVSSRRGKPTSFGIGRDGFRGYRAFGRDFWWAFWGGLPRRRSGVNILSCRPPRLDVRGPGSPCARLPHSMLIFGLGLRGYSE